MPTPIQLRIGTPCSSSWDHMTPTDPTTGTLITKPGPADPTLTTKPGPADQHRFCSSCQKTVTDFTGMNDRQILDWLSSHPGPLCGRFETSQLNRELSSPPQRRTGWPSRWNYLLASLLFSSEVTAQQQPINPPASHFAPSNRAGESSPINENSIARPANTLPDTISGQVLDTDNQIPVPFATVTIYGTRKGFQADADGKFSIPTKLLGTNHLLVITAVGYSTCQLDLAKSTFSPTVPHLIITLITMHATLSGDVVVMRKPRRAVRILQDTLSTLGIIDKALTIYPNPVNRGASITLNLRLDQPATYTVQLYSITGALIETMEVAGDQRSKDILMNIPPTLTPGNYFVRLSTPGSPKVHSRQVVIL